MNVIHKAIVTYIQPYTQKAFDVLRDVKEEIKAENSKLVGLDCTSHGVLRLRLGVDGKWIIDISLTYNYWHICEPTLELDSKAALALVPLHTIRLGRLQLAASVDSLTAMMQIFKELNSKIAVINQKTDVRPYRYKTTESRDFDALLAAARKSLAERGGSLQWKNNYCFSVENVINQ